MTFEKIVPATRDARGRISDILYGTEIHHVAIIESDGAGIIRGNHYHKDTVQRIFVVKGSLRYWYQPLSRNEAVQSIVVCEYEMVTTPPNEIHALEILENNQFVVFSTGRRGGRDYESDTFRVDPILTPDMVRVR
jgi:dTDP-4-dehydrorhamnose 3,5-epimerase-like enzyme